MMCFCICVFLYMKQRYGKICLINTSGWAIGENRHGNEQQMFSLYILNYLTSNNESIHTASILHGAENEGQALAYVKETPLNFTPISIHILVLKERVKSLK